MPAAIIYSSGILNVNLSQSVFGLLLAFILVQPVSAQDQVGQLKQRLQKHFTDLHITELKPAAIPGLYEMVSGTQVVFVSGDGRYMVTGDLIDLVSKRNLSAERRAGLVARVIKGMGENKMIVFGPDQPKRTLTVFTDVDCPYCVRFHQEMSALNNAGVRVRYLLYPRAEKGSETYKRSVAVWCASDRAKAVGIAKAGGKIDMKTCDNPVEEHLKLAADLGVNGTPTIVFDDGRINPGYMPAAQLLSILEIKDDQKAKR